MVGINVAPNVVVLSFYFLCSFISALSDSYFVVQHLTSVDNVGLEMRWD